MSAWIEAGSTAGVALGDACGVDGGVGGGGVPEGLVALVVPGRAPGEPLPEPDPDGPVAVEVWPLGDEQADARAPTSPARATRRPTTGVVG
jgi:hypothetical protein